MWSQDGDVTSVATDKNSSELAVAGMDGSITLWDTSIWQKKIVLFPNQPTEGVFTFIKYGYTKHLKLPKTFLMVSIRQFGKNNNIMIVS